MKTILNLSRWIVGILFIFSGLIKANDPLGLSYKMQEFFEVWGWHGWNDYTLALSVLMIAFEIIAGVALLIGWQLELFSWLLLALIVFFTFLTGYALFSGKIRTCGCFGDCIPLTADQSFIKDIILLLLILLLFFNRHRITTVRHSRKAVVLLALATVFSFGLQWYVLKTLPPVDCLPYKKGSSIAEQMKIPAGAIPDSTVISYVYMRDGKQVEFTADSFPEDFSEDSYQFVKRYDKLVRKGNAEPPIKDFVLVTATGNDTTQQVLEDPGSQYWLFVKEWPAREKDQQLLRRALAEKKPLYLITPAASELEEKLGAALAGIPVLRCDVVAVKTAARNPLTLYKVTGGRIDGKWPLRAALQ